MIERLLETDNIVAVAIETPDTPIRDRARTMVRTSLRTLLADKLGTAETTIQLISHPGRPIRLASPWSHVGLSVSHEPGRSAMAINVDGPIGIDLLHLGPPLPDIALLSRDYLGPLASTELAALAPERQQAGFARAWCRFEAKLKCLGLPLSEWSPAQEARLAACSLTDLPMPPGWIAAIATANKRH
jgi:4'-phosphopantetheinyl transferase